MAKNRKKVLTPDPNEALRDAESFIYYDKLHFIPKEDKDVEWAARVLLFNKFHSEPFVDEEKYHEIERSLRGEIDITFHKKMIDPEKGEAEFFHCDWKACPIDQHLDDILEATIKQIPVNLGVKAVDEYSISNQEQNNRKILNRGLLRNLINAFLTQLGFPALKPSDDPFQYVQKMQAQLSGAQQTPGASKAGKGMPQKQTIPNDVVQNLLSQIDSSELLGIYNQYIHKEGVEIACELGIDYYLNVKNKFTFNYVQPLLKDIMGHNKCCIRQFTSETTGTPVLEYIYPPHLRISRYKKRDLSDHTHWHYEYDIPFGEFMRMFGASMDRDQLFSIFELNRKWNGAPAFDRTSTLVNNSAQIRVGYCESQSQDMDVYGDYSIMGNKRFKQMPSDFVPGYKKDENGNLVKDAGSIENPTRVEEHKNVWYKFYYIPYFFSSNDYGAFDTKQQSQYIYKFGMLQDQERYGDDERFARSSLIGFYSEKMTWYEIKKRYKDQIDHLWLMFQNDMANVMPHGLNWAYDLIALMVNTVDNAKDNNKSAVNEWAAKLKQTGTAITKLMRDGSGNIIPNQPPPFQEIKSGHLEAAFEKLNSIMVLYTMMLKSLGQNELSEGEAPKPRTNLGSIQIALGASGKSTYFVEEAMSDVISCLGNKMLVYFKDIVDMGDSNRLQEFKDIVGQANFAALMEIKDIPIRNLGLFVEQTMTKDQKDMLVNIAQSMASAGTLDVSTALFLTMVDNLKYAYAILSFKKVQMDKQLAAIAQQKQTDALTLIQNQTQADLMKIQAQGKIKKDLEVLLGQIQTSMEEMVINLKGKWTMQGKEQIKNNRIEQDITSSNIEKLNNNEDPMPLEHHMPVAS